MGDNSQRMNLPSRLTVFRTVLTPAFMLVLILSFPTGSFNFANISIPFSRVLAVVIFAGASYVDYLDRHTTRVKGLVINLGKFADPLTDKMLVMTAFVLLVGAGRVPAWIVAIIVCRELAVTGLRLILAENDGEVLVAKMPGKIKTATQILSIISLLLGDIFSIGTILLYICLILAIYSGWDYFYQPRDAFAGEL